MTQNDAICNIELFRELCAQHVCTSVFALRTEDFIYKAPELKNNLISLLTEIFIKVELEKCSIDIDDSEDVSMASKIGEYSSTVDACQTESRVNMKENLNPNDRWIASNASR